MPAAQTSPEGQGPYCPQQFYGRNSFRSGLTPVGAIFTYAAVSAGMTVCDPNCTNGSPFLRSSTDHLTSAECVGNMKSSRIFTSTAMAGKAVLRAGVCRALAGLRAPLWESRIPVGPPQLAPL